MLGTEKNPEKAVFSFKCSPRGNGTQKKNMRLATPKIVYSREKRLGYSITGRYDFLFLWFNTLYMLNGSVSVADDACETLVHVIYVL